MEVSAVRNLITVALLLVAGQAWSDGALVQKAALQAAMQQHIERNLVDGALLRLDPADGTIERLFPTKTHPLVLEADGYFVLCVDLIGADGGVRLADFYIAPGDASYVVFKTEVDDRTLLHRLMNEGRVRPMD
jgi:hypothetical protein